MVTKINAMVNQTTFIDSIEDPGTAGSTPYSYGGGGGGYLALSHTNANTGSIVFTDTEITTLGGLDYYTFWGTKVCSVLGLPEGIPIYSENFKFSDSSTGGNYMSGDVIADGISVKKHFKMSSQARVKGSLIWDDVFGEGFIQWVSGSNTRMVMGYDTVNDTYRIDAPQITGSVAKIGSLSCATVNGQQSSTPQQIKFEADSIEFHENSVEAMDIRDTKVQVNSAAGDVDFFCFGDDATTILQTNAGTNQLHSGGNFDLTGHATIDKGLGVGTAGTTTVGLIRATNDVVAFYSSDKRLKKNRIRIHHQIIVT